MTIAEKSLVDHVLPTLEKDNRSSHNSLKKTYSQLKPYDQQLYTYLKANRTAKEIARILHISPDSVENSKHLMRKKLGLSFTAAWCDVLQEGLNVQWKSDRSHNMNENLSPFCPHVKIPIGRSYRHFAVGLGFTISTS